MPNAANQLLSGSWDGHAILWNIEIEQMLMKFGPHENGVSVLALPNLQIVTASTGESVDGKPANFQIRFWDGNTGKQIGSSIQDHTGSIRSIAALPGVGGFLTTSNDGSIIMRSVEGQPIEQNFHAPSDDGSPPFILNCAALETVSGMDFISCGEDGSLCVWAAGELTQSLPHPNSVWTATALPRTSIEGAFITGCHDGQIRVFARATEALKNNSLVQTLNVNFVEEVAAKRQAAQQGPSADEIAKAARWEDRGNHLRGRKENDVMVFNKDNTLIAAQFNSGSWVIIGEVTGKGDGGYIDSVWYDHVLPVEIETSTGPQSLQLGYNNAENPFVAAQRFIDKYGLGQSYLAQIADWIQQRAGKNQAPTLGESSGASRHSNNNNNCAASPAVSNQYSPAFSAKIDGYVVYDELPNQAKLLAKLQELNSTNNDGSGALDAASLAHVENAVKVLWETSRYHSSQISHAELQAILRLSSCYSWEKRFIAFDLLRVLILHPQSAETLAIPAAGQTIHSVVQTSIAFLTQLLQGQASSTLSAVQNTLLTTSKALANLLRSEPLRAALASLVPQIADTVSSLLAQPHLYTACNKHVRGSLLAVIYNFIASQFTYARGSSAVQTTVLTSLCAGLLQVIATETETEVTVYRAIQCLQTLLSSSGHQAEVKRLLLSRALLSIGTDTASYLLQTVLPRWSTSSTRLSQAVQEVALVVNHK